MARGDLSPEALGLPTDGAGVLASQHLTRAVDAGVIDGATDGSVQPASLDLHLGDVAYRIRCSFLPDASDAMLRAREAK